MPYVPTKSDATAVATDMAVRLTTAGVAVSPIDTTVALADNALCSTGLIGQSDAAGLGAATTTSTSFVDIGNGSSTGYSSWTVTAPIAKTYLLRVVAKAYASVSPGGNVYMQVLCDGSAIVGQPTATPRQFFGTLNMFWPLTWDVVVSLTAGSHTFKLQWKVDSGMTANVDTNGGRLFTLVGC